MTSQRTNAVGDIHGCSAALDPIRLVFEDNLVTLGNAAGRTRGLTGGDGPHLS
jgi:hypothetical protein